MTYFWCQIIYLVGLQVTPAGQQVIPIPTFNIINTIFGVVVLGGVRLLRNKNSMPVILHFLKK